MSLETATYINGLQAANPAESDAAGLSADHIRLVKSTLLATFPNITGPVSVRQDQINNAMPYGAIIMYWGTVAPAGWALCNGGTYAKADGSGNVTVPYLLDRIPIAAGLSYGLGSIGGSTAGTPTGTTGVVAADLAAHTHGVNDPGHGHSVADPGHAHTYSGPVGSVAQAGSINPVIGSASNQNTTVSGTGISIYGNTTGISIAVAGAGGGHNHPVYMNAMSIMPPYVGVTFLYKL